MEFSGRRIVVTGATRGIGRALVRQLIGEGAVVLAVARDQAALDGLAAELGGGVVPIRCDLAVESERVKLIARLTGDLGPLDGIINNAGVQSETDFLRDDPDWLAQIMTSEIAINLAGPLHLCIALLPHLARRPEGFILNVGSSLALAPKQKSPVYCATKAGLRSFSKSLRYQADGTGGRVNIVDGIMALVETDMTRGRGRGKITPERAAGELLAGIQRGKREIWVGKAKVLRLIDRVAPGLTARILR